MIMEIFFGSIFSLIPLFYFALPIAAGFFLLRGVYLMSRSLESINKNVSEVLTLLKTRETGKE